MASQFDDPGSWRLILPGSRVPLKFLGVSGSFEADKGSVEFKGLIPSSSLITFLNYIFPPPRQIGNLSLPQSYSLPGLPGLIAKSVSFNSFDENLPSDPFGFDPEEPVGTAPVGTYYKTLEVSVSFGMERTQEPAATDPLTFLEVSCQGTGEFIHTKAPKAKWQHQTDEGNTEPANPAAGSIWAPFYAKGTNTPKPAGKPADAKVDRTPGVDANGNTDTSTEPVADPSLDVNIRVPILNWTLKWKQVPHDYFHSMLVHRLRWGLGLVNSTPFYPIANACPETILFTEYDYNESYTWKAGTFGKPPIDVTMKFVEKRNLWNGRICGHNHFWMPSKGWMYLLINGKTLAAARTEYTTAFQAWVDGGRKGLPPSQVTGGPTYQSCDLNDLFKV